MSLSLSLSQGSLERRIEKEKVKEVVSKAIGVIRDIEVPVQGDESQLDEAKLLQLKEAKSQLRESQDKLRKLRLSGDEFFVVIVESELGKTKEKNGPGMQDCCVLELTSTSAIHLHEPSKNPRWKVEDGRPGAAKLVTTSIDNLSKAKAGMPDPSSCSRLSLPGGPWGGIRLEWKKAPQCPLKADALTMLVVDAHELLDTIGDHLQRYNQNRVRLVEQLRTMYARKKTTYQSSNPEHEDALYKFWNVSLPDTKLTGRISEQWVDLGFQGTDPATDFRGMGMLALDNLLYLGNHHPDMLQRLARLQTKRQYPLALVGINLSHMIVSLLGLNDALVEQHPGSEKWETPLFMCFTRFFEFENPFCELFCLLMDLLDKMYVVTRAGLCDFGQVNATLKSQLEYVLSWNPTTFSDLEQWLLENIAVRPVSSGSPSTRDRTLSQ